MRKGDRDTVFCVRFGFYVTVVLALFIVPLQWVCAWYTAILFHELLHFCAIRICGCRIYQIQLSHHGAIMETEELSDLQSLFCALAGPLAGILLLLTAKWFPRLAVCGLIQSLYNLLPIIPLDGGRALRGFLCGVLKLRSGETIAHRIGGGLLILLFAGALYAVVRLQLGFLLLIFVILLYLKNKNIKIACKASPERVK